MRTTTPAFTAVAATLLLTACSGYPARDAGVRPALPVVDWVAAKGRRGPGERLEVLAFPDPGTRTVGGQIEGESTTVYAVPARAGQRIEVSMASTDPGASFEILDARRRDDWGPLATASGEGAGAGIFVPLDGTYLVRPHVTRPALERTAAADYVLTIARR
jgi:hypothetical protein